MKRPRWLDRELRIYRLNILLRQAEKDRDLYWRRYQSKSADLVVAQSQLDNARADYAAARAEADALRTKYEGATP